MIYITAYSPSFYFLFSLIVCSTQYYTDYISCALGDELSKQDPETLYSCESI